MFFGAAPELDRYFDTLRDRIRRDPLEFVILRLKRVRDPDAVTIERLEHFLREENGREHDGRTVTVLLAGVRPDTLKVLRNIGFDEWFPPEQVFPEEVEEFSATLRAVRYAQAKQAAQVDEAPEDAKLYYLV